MKERRFVPHVVRRLLISLEPNPHLGRSFESEVYPCRQCKNEYHTQAHSDLDVAYKHSVPISSS